MFESHTGNVLFTHMDQIDQLAHYKDFTVQPRPVRLETGKTATFYEVVAANADNAPRTIFFSDDEKTAHNFRDLAEIGSVYFRNFSSH